MDKNDDELRPLPKYTENSTQMRLSVEDVQSEGEPTRRAQGFTTMPSPTSKAPSIDNTVSNVQQQKTPPHPPPSTTGRVLEDASKAPARDKSLSNVQEKRRSPPQPWTTGWVLEDAPVLPAFHKLERTAVFCPHSSAQSIAARVSATLKNRSIQAKYNGPNAECQTMENVLFSVFLYRGKKEYSHGIICEVQRRFGDSFCYWEDAAAILDAAENKTRGEPRKKKARSMPIVEDDCESESTSIDFLHKLFEAGSDSQLIGLQILSSMTDASKMGSTVATATSRVLMEPGNEIAGMVLKLLKEPSLAFQSMIVLSNIASVADLPITSLKTFLIDQLQSKESQAAYLASKCLKPQDVDSDAEFADAINQAKQLGAEEHDGLYNQAVALLSSLSGI